MTLPAGSRFAALAALALPFFAAPAAAAIYSIDLTLTPTMMVNGPVGGITSVPADPIAVHMSFNVAGNGFFTQSTAQIIDFAVDFPSVSYDESDVGTFSVYVDNGVLTMANVGTYGGVPEPTLVILYATHQFSEDIFLFRTGPSCQAGLASGTIYAPGPCVAGTVTAGVSAVPEPASAMTFGLGLMALGFALRFRPRRHDDDWSPL
jgi:hypothetical protein